jgi:hypothetical protein
MLEYWNDGVAPFGQINACGGELINPLQRSKSMAGPGNLSSTAQDYKEK